MPIKNKSQQRKHQNEIKELDAKTILRDATEFLNSLEDLRSQLVVRDAAYQEVKKTKDKEKKELYLKLSAEVSQKCLDYGRALCEQPVPYWVDAHMSKEHAAISHHAYEVIRNKICSSLNVFDGDLLPNARALVRFAEDNLQKNSESQTLLND